MNPIARLNLELGQLGVVLDKGDLARYCARLVTSMPAIVRARTLAPADTRMAGTVGVTLRGRKLKIPLDELRHLLAKHDPTPTFGAVREMYASDVYLRRFPRDLKARTVIDLGSNRGLFLLLAGCVLDAEMAVGVEPCAYYEDAFWAMARANGLDAKRFARVGKLAASTSRADAVTIDELMHRHGMQTVAFMKCDIEGGEFDIFLDNNAFITRVENLAMELHPEAGEVARLVAALQDGGHDVIVTDQFGKPCQEVQRGEYLYASRTGNLSPN